MVALSLLRYLASTYNPLRRAYNRGYVDATAAARRNAERRTAMTTEHGEPQRFYFGMPSSELTESDLRALAEDVRLTAESFATGTHIPSGDWENCILQDCKLTCCPDKSDEVARDCR